MTTTQAAPSRRKPLTKERGGLTEIRRLTMDQVCETFTPTPGWKAPAEIRDDSTGQIPEPSMLKGRKGTNINGEAQYQIVWEYYVPTMPIEDIIVATADPIAGNDDFSEFMRIYSISPICDRADMLGRKDWIEMQRAIIGDITRRQTAPDGRLIPASTANYQTKVVMAPSKLPEGEGTVMFGTAASGRKRMTWMGHSGFALARYLGKHGWTGAEAVNTYEKIGLPMGKGAIIGGVYAGKAGQRGDPAPVTPAQHQILQTHLDAFRQLKADGYKKEQTPHIPLTPPLKQTPTTRPMDPSLMPPPTSGMSKSVKAKVDRDQKLAQAITRKAGERKANKAKATKKAQATKAAKKMTKA